VFAVALAFNPVREWLRGVVDRTFFRERYDYARAIGALARSMTSLLDLDEITRRVTTTVESTMLGATKIEGRAGTRWTYTASGITTNVAARLAAVAQGGEIVVSEATVTRLGLDAAAENLGVRELKNVETPLRLFRLR